MLRISHWLVLAVGGVALLAQPALAQAQTHRHDRHVVHSYPHRSVPAMVNDVATSPFYGPFGGYPEAAAAAQYPGRDERRYGFGGAAPIGAREDRRAEYSGMVEAQASANGIPASLVHRVIMRESGYNPRAANASNYGMMQIRLGTARAMGYSGSAAGLLDAETNMTYAVRYLAGAYHAAGGNENLAVALYARGYNARPVQQGSFETAGSLFAPAPEPQSAWGAQPQYFAYAGDNDGQPGAYRVKHYRRHPA